MLNDLSSSTNMFYSLEGSLFGSLFQMHQVCIKIDVFFFFRFFNLFFHFANESAQYMDILFRNNFSKSCIFSYLLHDCNKKGFQHGVFESVFS